MDTATETPERSWRETTPDIQLYIAEKLNGTVFSAWYSDRIWIDDLRVYLDQIRVDEDELHIRKVLKSIQRRVSKLRPGFSGIESTTLLKIGEKTCYHTFNS